MKVLKTGLKAVTFVAILLILFSLCAAPAFAAAPPPDTRAPFAEDIIVMTPQEFEAFAELQGVNGTYITLNSVDVYATNANGTGIFWRSYSAGSNYLAVQMSATDRDNARNQHYDYWTVTAYVTLNSVFNIVITDSSNRIYSNNYSPRLSGNSNYKFPPAVIGSSHFWEWKVNSGAEIATINFVG